MSIIDKFDKAAKEIIDDAVVQADLDGDGKISLKEWITYFINNPSLLIVVIISLMARPFISFITLGLSTGTWDAAIFTDSFSELIVPLIFGWFFKQNGGHYKELIENERTKRVSAIKYYKDEYNKIAEKLKRKEAELVQMNLALELKKQEIVFMEKGLVNGKHRTIEDKDFNKP